MEHFYKSYEMIQSVSIKNSTIGAIHRIIQCLIVFYVFGYVLLYSKGYQRTGEANSVVTTKIKGVTVTNFSEEDFQIKENYHLYNRVWDSAEFTIPSSENMAFFVMTNVIITPNQTMKTCPEDYQVEGSICSSNGTGCKAGSYNYLGSGRNTGKCVESPEADDVSVCGVEAWCPVENSIFPLKRSRAVLEDSQYYTVMIKNSINFQEFGPEFKRTNILKEAKKCYLRKCLYNEKTDPLCPIFRVKDLVEMAGERFMEIAFKSKFLPCSNRSVTTFPELAVLLGAALAIIISWDCDLNYDFNEHCIPKYFIQRLDDKECSASPGWNFRHSYHHEFGRRTLLKLYGIKFVIDVRAKGSKFSIVPTVINFASGLALMSMATIICDIIVKLRKIDEISGDDSDGRNSSQEKVQTRKLENREETELKPLREKVETVEI